ncbi:hypothetical protein M0812_07568 [Anaeramoeba flamelloides]|uniref:B-block binding subunit of TFIIIC domain-containing protein n=1 Tax=Anaeramoeba flamelloides TaxID=1746091 RepID=A0AAV8A539_9EUKA|nr:hypothetical protein M0812_07568 [Anaeramoeba flamelloides]
MSNKKTKCFTVKELKNSKIRTNRLNYNEIDLLEQIWKIVNKNIGIFQEQLRQLLTQKMEQKPFNRLVTLLTSHSLVQKFKISDPQTYQIKILFAKPKTTTFNAYQIAIKELSNPQQTNTDDSDSGNGNGEETKSNSGIPTEIQTRLNNNQEEASLITTSKSETNSPKNKTKKKKDQPKPRPKAKKRKPKIKVPLAVNGFYEGSLLRCKIFHSYLIEKYFYSRKKSPSSKTINIKIKRLIPELSQKIRLQALGSNQYNEKGVENNVLPNNNNPTHLAKYQQFHLAKLLMILTNISLIKLNIEQLPKNKKKNNKTKIFKSFSLLQHSNNKIHCWINKEISFHNFEDLKLFWKKFEEYTNNQKNLKTVLPQFMFNFKTVWRKYPIFTKYIKSQLKKAYKSDKNLNPKRLIQLAIKYKLNPKQIEIFWDHQLKLNINSHINSFIFFKSEKRKTAFNEMDDQNESSQNTSSQNNVTNFHKKRRIIANKNNLRNGENISILNSIKSLSVYYRDNQMANNEKSFIYPFLKRFESQLENSLPRKEIMKIMEMINQFLSYAFNIVTNFNVNNNFKKSKKNIKELLKFNKSLTFLKPLEKQNRERIIFHLITAFLTFLQKIDSYQFWNLISINTLIMYLNIPRRLLLDDFKALLNDSDVLNKLITLIADDRLLIKKELLSLKNGVDKNENNNKNDTCYDDGDDNGNNKDDDDDDDEEEGGEGNIEEEEGNNENNGNDDDDGGGGDDDDDDNGGINNRHKKIEKVGRDVEKRKEIRLNIKNNTHSNENNNPELLNIISKNIQNNSLKIVPVSTFISNLQNKKTLNHYITKQFTTKIFQTRRLDLLERIKCFLAIPKGKKKYSKSSVNTILKDFNQKEINQIWDCLQNGNFITNRKINNNDRVIWRLKKLYSIKPSLLSTIKLNIYINRNEKNIIKNFDQKIISDPVTKFYNNINIATMIKLIAFQKIGLHLTIDFTDLLDLGIIVKFQSDQKMDQKKNTNLKNILNSIDNNFINDYFSGNKYNVDGAEKKHKKKYLLNFEKNQEWLPSLFLHLPTKSNAKITVNDQLWKIFQQKALTLIIENPGITFKNLLKELFFLSPRDLKLILSNLEKNHLIQSKKIPNYPNPFFNNEDLNFNTKKDIKIIKYFFPTKKSFDFF